MRHRLRIRTVVATAAIAMTALFGLVPTAFAQTASTCPTLKISIPGYTVVSFDKIKTGADYVYQVPCLANYISAVYGYGVYAALVVAAVMTVVGGFEWLTAGDSGRVSKAKTRITNAVVGLVLALGAFVILNTVDPALVKLNALEIKTIIEEPLDRPITLVPAAEITAATGEPLKPATEMIALAMAEAEKTGIKELPCFVRGSMQFESRGNPNAIGHDENASNGRFPVGSRQKFLSSGLFYSGQTFTKIPCATKECQKLGPKNDDINFDINAPPDYGLDWRFSHGFGAGQSTIRPDAPPCSGREAEGRGKVISGKCYTIKDLMTTSKQIEAMVRHYKACWDRGAGNAAAGYVCYQGNVEEDNPVITKRVAVYEQCINSQ